MCVCVCVSGSCEDAEETYLWPGPEGEGNTLKRCWPLLWIFLSCRTAGRRRFLLFPWKRPFPFGCCLVSQESKGTNDSWRLADVSGVERKKKKGILEKRCVVYLPFQEMVSQWTTRRTFWPFFLGETDWYLHPSSGRCGEEIDYIFSGPLKKNEIN